MVPRMIAATRRLIAAISRLSTWSGRIGALVVTPLVIAMVYEVLSRYLFDAPTQWAFEISYMLMGTVFLLGISYALAVDAHVRVDFIHQRAPRRLTAAWDLICYVILTGLFVWMTWALFNNALKVMDTGETTGLSAWNPPVWPYRLVYVAGFGLMALQTFARILGCALTVLGHDEPEPPHQPESAA